MVIPECRTIDCIRIDVRMRNVAFVTLALESGLGDTWLGHDCDGASWKTVAIGGSDPKVNEGLAQFYTEVVPHKINDDQPDAFAANERFLVLQCDPYVGHKDWLEEVEHECSESVRFTLLASRTEGVVEPSECSPHRLRRAKSCLNRPRRMFRRLFPLP